MDGTLLRCSPKIKILGITVDEHLTFKEHVREVAARAGRKLSMIRRVSDLLDEKGCVTLYNSQVRSLMEYCPLTWSSCAPSHLNLLEDIQRRAKRLMDWKAPGHRSQYQLQPLSPRREISALCVFFKLHKQGCEHLGSLRMKKTQLPTPYIRGSDRRNEELNVPFARTAQFLRCFQPKYVRLWNELVRSTDLASLAKLQDFKVAVHRWRLPHYILS